jgi:hypothetical protein
MDTPSQVLSNNITHKLILEGLITPDAAKKIGPKLAEGKLRPEDWRLLIELTEKKGAGV